MFLNAIIQLWILYLVVLEHDYLILGREYNSGKSNSTCHKLTYDNLIISK